MFFRKKKIGEGMVHGNSKEMELTVGKIPFKDRVFHWQKADAAGSVRFGYNAQKDMFWIQIFHKKTEVAFRIFLTSDEFKALSESLKQTYYITKYDKGDVAK